jgi:hypothetical protein
MRTDLTPETTHFEKVRAESLQHLARGKVRIYATHRESELSHWLKRFSFNAYFGLQAIPFASHQPCWGRNG